jgi:hypothetical protein
LSLMVAGLVVFAYRGCVATPCDRRLRSSRRQLISAYHREADRGRRAMMEPPSWVGSMASRKRQVAGPLLEGLARGGVGAVEGVVGDAIKTRAVRFGKKFRLVVRIAR